MDAIAELTRSGIIAARDRPPPAIAPPGGRRSPGGERANSALWAAIVKAIEIRTATRT